MNKLNYETPQVTAYEDMRTITAGELSNPK